MTQAILAGFLIGIGDIALMKSGNPYVGAFLFAVALMTIIYFELPLYTGRVGRIYKDRTWAGLFLGLLFNVIGASLAVWLFQCMSPENVQLTREMTEAKLIDKNYLTLFIAGILCNVLIHLAVSTRHTIIVILCVMAFIICGFEHSIADAPYAILSFDFEIVFSWLFVLLGNTVGGIATEWLLTFQREEDADETAYADIPIDDGTDPTDHREVVEDPFPSSDSVVDGIYTQVNEGDN